MSEDTLEDQMRKAWHEAQARGASELVAMAEALDVAVETAMRDRLRRRKEDEAASQRQRVPKVRSRLSGPQRST